MATTAEITQLYQNILGRAPDPEGLAFWQASGQTPAQLEQAFKASPEAQVAAIYQNVLGRAPDPEGSQFYQQQLAQPGSGGLFGVYSDIKRSQEAMKKQTVTGLYQDILGRAPDVAGKEFWEKELAAGKSITDVRDAIRKSAENTVPNRPSFDDVFARWNEEHAAKYGTYYNTARVNQEQFDTQMKALAERTQEEQKKWDEKYGKTQEAQIMTQVPPPNWYDMYAKYDQEHRANFGIGMNRSWSTDENSRRDKERLDKEYLAALSDYNQRYGTNIQPDVGVLGLNTQPNSIYQLPPAKKKSLLQTIAPYAGIALSFAIPGAGAALGGLAGLSGTAASIAGNAVIGGAVSGLAGGNVLQGAVLGGIGGAISGSGVLNDIGSGLTDAFAEITGLDSAAIKSYFSSFSQPGSATAFAAEDAANMAKQGLSTSAIQQNLIASGMDSLTAATLANNAVMPGATVASLASSIANQPVYTNVAGLLSGGDPFATTQSVFDKLVTAGMSPTDAAQIINTTGGGLDLGTVGVDATGKLVQTAAGQAGTLLGGATGATAAGATSTLANAATKALTAGATTLGGQIGSGLLSTAAGVGGSMLDRAALDRQAQALRDAANQYTPQMQFQPVGVTTRFGRTTTPQYDAQGRLLSVGYTPSADIAAQQNRALALSAQALPETTNIQQATQNYYDQLQALQRPTDELTLAQLQNRLQATGRGGLAFGATSGAGGSQALMATNPELAAYYNALAQRQGQQALTAQDVAQQRLNQQIATSGTLFGQARGIEELVQQPLALSSQFGQQATAGSTNVARNQLEAAGLAARLQAQGALGVNQAITGGAAGIAPALGNVIGTAIGNLF